MTVKEACAQSGGAVHFDAAAGTLTDVASGASLQVGEDASATGVEIGSQGLLFAPRFDHTGPLENVGPKVSWSDYATRCARVKAALFGPHAELPVRRETALLLMSCIAIADGARAVGFGVSAQERELNACLLEMEARVPPETEQS